MKSLMDKYILSAPKAVNRRCNVERKTRESQVKAVRRYDDAHTVQFRMKLNKKTDADIIEFLGSLPNKQGFLKQIIREHIDIESRE